MVDGTLKNDGEKLSDSGFNSKHEFARTEPESYSSRIRGTFFVEKADIFIDLIFNGSVRETAVHFTFDMCPDFRLYY